MICLCMVLIRAGERVPGDPLPKNEQWVVGAISDKGGILPNSTKCSKTKKTLKVSHLSKIHNVK